MKLKNYVPPFVIEIKEINNILDSQQDEFNKLNLTIEDIKKQCFIGTATWGLTLWEDFLGIKNDTKKSTEERRSRILAKVRGTGTTTKELLKEMALAYADDVEVVEDNSNYSFKINLESLGHGFPYKLNSLYSSINEIKPAHLNANYSLKSTTKTKFYLGSILRTSETITIYPWTPKNTSVAGKIYIPTSNNRSTETVTIYPKGGR